jgi:hypothetical protein
MNSAKPNLPSGGAALTSFQSYTPVQNGRFMRVLKPEVR